MADCLELLAKFKAATEEAKVGLINSLIHLGCKRHSHRLFDTFERESLHFQISIVFAMRTIANAEAKRILAELLSDASLAVPLRAALTEVAGDLHLTQCLPVIRQQLSDESPEIRFWSCEALGMIGESDDKSLLQALLSDHTVGYLDSTVADAAGQALKFITSL